LKRISRTRLRSPHLPSLGQPEPERNVEAQREFQPIDKTEPGFFDPLNEALAQVKADITQGIDPFDAYQEAMMQLDPTRPEGHPTDHLFHWPPESQSMEHQQRAALERDHVVNGDRTADLANEYAAGLARLIQRMCPGDAKSA